MHVALLSVIELDAALDMKRLLEEHGYAVKMDEDMPLFREAAIPVLKVMPRPENVTRDAFGIDFKRWWKYLVGK